MVSAVTASPPPRRTFLEDIDRLFVPSFTKPDVHTRALRSLAGIDWDAPTIVIWVPPTNGHGIDERVAAGVAQLAPGAAVASVDYQATWQFLSSEPDGEAALEAVLDEVRRHKRPGQRVLLLAESQGGWVASGVLANPAYASLVDRAAFIAHPSMAPEHAHDTLLHTPKFDSRTVREFNSPSDVVTHDFGAAGTAAIPIIDAFAHLRIGHALLGALHLFIQHPSMIPSLLRSQKYRVTGGASPHNGAAQFDDGLRWLLR